MDADNVMKAPRFLVGTDDFCKLLLNSNVFVDKSLFIKDLIEDSGDVILIVRPRRWGKSLNMNMLRRFLEIEVDEQGNPLPFEQRVNNKLFLGGEVDLGFDEIKQLKPLKIAKYQDVIKRQGKFPVILLNLKDVKGGSYQEIEDKVRLNVRSLYKSYSYLMHSPKITPEEKQDFQKYLQGNVDLAYLQNSLVFLNTLLFQHFNQKSYILIDEYDTPINGSYLKFADDRPKEFEQVLELFRIMFGSSLKTNQYLEKGVITGILRIAKANLLSDINNVSENTLLDKNFAQFYGFTQEEVNELLEQCPTNTPAEKIKSWYNGYNFGGETIYNPWSIMQCLSRDGSLETYWIDSGGTGIVDNALVSDETQEDLQTLLKGESITVPITKQISFEDIKKPRGFFSLLLFSGYLNPHAIDAEKSIYALSIPNQEVKLLYELRVMDWLVDKLGSDTVAYYSFVALLATGKVEAFKEYLQGFLQNAASYFQTEEKKAELFYSGFMLCLINTISITHDIDSERESGDGRPDIVLIPKSERRSSLAIIIEYKVSKTIDSLATDAIIALEQIQNKRYDIKLNKISNIKQILKIGMAFFGKNV